MLDRGAVAGRIRSISARYGFKVAPSAEVWRLSVGERQKQPFAEKVAVNGDQYTVAFTRDNTLHATAAVFGSHTAAEQYLNDAVGRDGTLSDQLHVLP